MLFVKRLIWDSWNIKHIARHHVTPDEIEEICHNLPIVLRGQQKKRLVVIGETHENWIIAIVLRAKGGGKYYPVTAYEADRHDKALYKRLRGGDNNEKNSK